MGAATSRPMDRVFLALLATLVVFGIAAFSSASLGILARGEVSITSVVFNHLVLGVGLGSAALIIASRIHYRFWRTAAPYVFGLALAISVLVFVPGLGHTSGGATRWVDVGGFRFQPSETLKIGTVLMLAAYLSKERKRIGELRYGLGGFLAILAAPVLIFLLQPDHDTLVVVGAGATATYIAAGAKWRDIGILLLIGIIGLASVIAIHPYTRARVKTFLEPGRDQANSGYQIKQSLIAIGSGGFFGRGFGQSVQKFSYLPEPMNDSIFAVIGEEFGFLGTALVVGLFTALAARGYAIAARTPDHFGAVLAVGIITLIVVQAFINMSALLAIIPLVGIPLIFISQGGTSMLVALGTMGILLNISRFRTPVRKAV